MVEPTNQSGPCCFRGPWISWCKNLPPWSHWWKSPAVQPYDVEGLIEAGVKTWSDPMGETVIYHDIPVEHGLTWPIYRWFIWKKIHIYGSLQEGSHGFTPNMIYTWCFFHILGTTFEPLGKISKTFEPRRKSMFSPTKYGVSLDLCKRRARKSGNYGFYHHKYHRTSKYRASRKFSHHIWELAKHSHHILLVYIWPFIKMSLSGLVDKS